MSGSEVVVIVFWAVPACFVWLMVRRPSDHSVAAFAKAYAVPLTSRNVDQLRRYIQWTRRWRVGGAVTLVVLAGGLGMLDGRGGPAWWIPLVIGYSVGSLVGELLRPVDRDANGSIAILTPRRISDYVTRRFVVVVVAVFVASLVPAFYLLVTNPQRSWIERPEPPGIRPQDWFVVALAATSVAMAAVCWFGGRALAQASAPADSPDRQAVRHAIRSAAIMSVIGGATMIMGAVGSKFCNAANSINGYGDSGAALSWLLAICTLVCGLGAMWGAILTLTTVPRLAPFSGALPKVPWPEPGIES